MGSSLKPNISLSVVSWALLLLSQCMSAIPRHRHSMFTNVTSNKNIINTTLHNSDVHITLRDEVSLKFRRDGLRELRIAFNGILVLETSSYPQPTSANAPRHTVRLLQATDGKQLVHTVMEADSIRDCRWSRQQTDVLDFIEDYAHAAPRRPRLGDVLELYDDEDLLLTPIAANITHRARHRKGNPLLRGVTMPLGNSEQLGRFSRYLQVAKQLRNCRRFQSRVKQYLGVPKSGSNRTVKAGSSGAGGSRRKRDLMTGWFIFPGTKWCGSGDIAEHPNDLGYDEALDSCCRDHDLCPHIIPRFTWRYNLFNFHMHTLSHCRCDKRFRRCLKKSTSPAAHMVGKIFFNVMGSQCFKFTRERTCKRRNWWGMCKRYGKHKVAHPRKQRAF